MFVPTSRLYKLDIRLKTTKQRVQMHSTATDVRTLADGKTCFVRTPTVNAIRLSPGTVTRTPRSDFS